VRAPPRLDVARADAKASSSVSFTLSFAAHVKLELGGLRKAMSSFRR
jgi:hypothetical protein